MFLGREQKNVVQVHKNEDIEHVPQDIIHELLENSRSVDEPEQKNPVFEVA